MKLKIIADNYTDNKKLKECWGFSVIIGDDILFDTADSPETFLYNAKQLDIDLSAIKKVVISHDHWDHIGGLEALLKINPNITVYGLPGFSENFKKLIKKYGARLEEIDTYHEIADNIFVSGAFSTAYKSGLLQEQALIVKGEEGAAVIYGCAHPGVVKMIKNIKKSLPGEINLIMGGFHLAQKSSREIKDIIKELKDLGVKKAAPTHCTGEAAISMFKEAYAHNFIPAKAGMSLTC